MNILFCIDSLKSGGKERQLVELVKGLNRYKSIKCHVVVMRRDIFFDELDKINIPISYLIRKSKNDLSIFIKLFSLCKKIKPDIIHTWDAMTSVYTMLISKILKIKFINGSIRTATPQQRYSKKSFLVKVIFPFSDRIVANSLSGLKMYKLDSLRKSSYIFNGIDLSRIDSIKTKESIRKDLMLKDEKIIGMVANFTRTKDYKTFIDVAQRILVKRDDVAFVSVGDGVMFEDVKNRVKDKNKHKIQFLGQIKDIESVINIFDICLLLTPPGIYEGISNSILEYMALAKPIVATEGGGTNEVVIDGKTGYLVQPGKTEEVILKIEFLMNNEKKAKKMGEAGRTRVREVFSLDKMVSSYLGIYEKLLHK